MLEGLRIGSCGEKVPPTHTQELSPRPGDNEGERGRWGEGQGQRALRILPGLLPHRMHFLGNVCNAPNLQTRACAVPAPGAPGTSQ